MKGKKSIGIVTVVMCVCGVTLAQSVNVWRGNEVKASWSDPYKWKLRHVPKEDEAVHFRQPNSVVEINRTVDLNNSMMLYGQELFLEGNGNINFWSPVENQSTIYVPASASGYANLTVRGNLSIKGGVALAAKAFGTSASKGTLTLRDRATIKGRLTIGNDGKGTGQLFVYDRSVYTISDLKIQTIANQGGAAEIHIEGGTVHFTLGTNPLEIFLADPGRKIIMGEEGFLRIQSTASIEEKKGLLIKLLKDKSLRTTPDARFVVPIFQGNTVVLKAERSDTPQNLDTLIAKIQAAAFATEPDQTSSTGAETSSGNSAKGSSGNGLPGYIVFLGLILFFLHPAKPKKPLPAS